MNAVTHLEKVITGEVSAVTHLEKVIAGETSAVTYTEKVITGEAPPITHLQKVIAGEASPVTHLEYVWAGGTPSPTEHEYTGAVPYTFRADGSPLISWRISGNTVQNGTPTPDNPVMPKGTGERTGNLYNINAKNVNNGYVNNAQLSQDGTTETWGSAEISEYIPISGDTAYTFDGIGSYNSPCYALYDENKQLIGAYKYNGRNTINFISPNNARYFRFTHIKSALQSMMVEGAYTSSTMPEFEPYGYKLTISSANTATPIYLGEVETTRKIYKMRLINPLSTTETPNGYRLLFSISSHRATSYQYGGGRCNITKWNGDYNKIGFVAATTSVFITQNIAEWATLEGATAWLDEHEVYIWYVLENEETGIVNEPLMKIGDYADEVSNVATIPTNNGSTTIDIDTTVKPSEVYIKYKGV